MCLNFKFNYENKNFLKCKKPMVDRVKCNIDVSFPSVDSKVDIDIYIRDEIEAFVLLK